MKQSFLTNERIYLRAVEPEDLDIMYEMEMILPCGISVVLQFRILVLC